jgi:hypothetical protein
MSFGHKLDARGLLESVRGTDHFVQETSGVAEIDTDTDTDSDPDARGIAKE